MTAWVSVQLVTQLATALAPAATAVATTAGIPYRDSMCPAPPSQTCLLPTRRAPALLLRPPLNGTAAHCLYPRTCPAADPSGAPVAPKSGPLSSAGATVAGAVAAASTKGSSAHLACDSKRSTVPPCTPSKPAAQLSLAWPCPQNRPSPGPSPQAAASGTTAPPGFHSTRIRNPASFPSLLPSHLALSGGSLCRLSTSRRQPISFPHRPAAHPPPPQSWDAVPQAFSPAASPSLVISTTARLASSAAVTRRCDGVGQCLTSSR